MAEMAPPASVKQTASIYNLQLPDLPQSRELSPTLTPLEMYSKLQSYHNSLNEEVKGHFKMPSHPSASGIISDPTLRGFDHEKNIGIVISSSDYSHRQDPQTGRFTKREDAGKTAFEIEIKVYAKASATGDGERELTIMTTPSQLNQTISKLESDITSGSIQSKFTHIWARNADTGRLELTPIPKNPNNID